LPALSHNRPSATLSEANGRSPEAPTENELPELVTLSQAAILVGRTVDGLRHYRRKGMPRPYVEGKKGQPNEYLWSEMKPWLEKTFNRLVPDLEIRKFRAQK